MFAREGSDWCVPSSSIIQLSNTFQDRCTCLLLAVCLFEGFIFSWVFVCSCYTSNIHFINKIKNIIVSFLRVIVFEMSVIFIRFQVRTPSALIPGYQTIYEGYGYQEVTYWYLYRWTRWMAYWHTHLDWAYMTYK